MKGRKKPKNKPSGTRPFTGKTSWRTRKAAQTEQRGCGAINPQVYRCPLCGAYHVTGQPLRGRQSGAT